jgi:hypothetical protein
MIERDPEVDLLTTAGRNDVVVCFLGGRARANVARGNMPALSTMPPPAAAATGRPSAETNTDDGGGGRHVLPHLRLMPEPQFQSLGDISRYVLDVKRPLARQSGVRRPMPVQQPATLISSIVKVQETGQPAVVGEEIFIEAGSHQFVKAFFVGKGGPKSVHYLAKLTKNTKARFHVRMGWLYRRNNDEQDPDALYFEDAAPPSEPLQQAKSAGRSASRAVS